MLLLLSPRTLGRVKIGSFGLSVSRALAHFAEFLLQPDACVLVPQLKHCSCPCVKVGVLVAKQTIAGRSVAGCGHGCRKGGGRCSELGATRAPFVLALRRG